MAGNGPKVFVALDVGDVAAARALVMRLGDSVSCYKIGYQLAFAGGLDFAGELAAAGKTVFLDMKLHDIGNTVEKAVEQIARIGVSYLTVHAFPQTMRAAAKAAKGTALKILGVTVMTSYDDDDLKDAGYSLTVEQLVAKRAKQAQDIGIHGLILSPHEVAMVRALVGSSLELITPGVRPLGSDKGDQKRVMIPSEAIKAGADGLVIGRPITAAADPKAAAEAIMAEVGSSIGQKAKKGYWVARVDVHDAESYRNYVARNGAAFVAFGGRFLVRGGQFETAVGTSRTRNVVLEFPSYEAAMACWHSDLYQAARAEQKGGAEMDAIIIEGYDGPQPQ